MIGGLRTLDGELDAAVESYIEARDLLRQIGADDDGALLSLRVAELRMRRGEFTLARTEAARARDLGSRGAPMQNVLVDTFSARIARQSGDLEGASAYLANAVQHLARASTAHPGSGQLRSLVLSTSVLISLDLGQLDGVGETAAEAYNAAVATRDMPIVSLVGVAIATLAAHEGAFAEAAQILGATARLTGSGDDTNVDISTLTATLRGALGDDEFGSGYDNGRAMTKEAAIARLDPATLSSAQARFA
jgi:hypothetical protein